MQSSIHFDSEQLLKIIVVGKQEVGKSSLITRYFDKKFTNSVMTVGVDYRVAKNFKSENGKIYQVSIWDTAGQEQFKSIVKFSCKGSHGALVCFDMANLESLLSVPEWISFLKQNCPENIVIAVVGTKSDQENLIDKEKIQEVLQNARSQSSNEIKYFETSAKTKLGVYEMFNQTFNLVSINFEKYFRECIVVDGRCKLTKDKSKEGSKIGQDKTHCC